MSSFVLSNDEQSKDIKFKMVKDNDKHKIFTFEKLESEFKWKKKITWNN